jgi:pyruvate,water dikinase
MHQVYASLYNDRAISYRTHQGFDHAQSRDFGRRQHMVRSDVGASGVMFGIDTESGFRDAVFITASGASVKLVVQGAVNPDEFYVYKPALRPAGHAIIPHGHRLQGVAHGLRRGPGAGTLGRVEVTAADRALLHQ